MTDKELIKQKIERLHELLPVMDGDNVSINYAETICTALEKYIDSLPEESASEDLEEAAKQHSKQTFNGILIEDNIDAFKAGAEWQRQKDLEDSLKSDMTMPNKFYEKGRFDMREEMMKDAVETIIVNDWQYGKDPDYAIIPAIHQRIKGFNVDDKVKIIIVKEE